MRVAAIAALFACAGLVSAQNAVRNPDVDPDDDPVEARVSLPTDRLKERQLDRARRLIADGRWSDAATLLDEMLAGDRDFFFRPQHGQATWRSIKAEAASLIGTLPPDGRSAYDLQFRARADRMLEQSIAAGDGAGIVAVARRWSHTPAGGRATMLAALESLDAGQPLAAAAWLERLSAGGDAFEPTASVVKAVAWWRAGDRRAALAALEDARRRGGTTMRLGGREVSLAFPAAHAAEWLEAIAGAGSPTAGRRDAESWMVRGDAARNARVDASRPLMVPRYRVPLTRHPEEARLLEKRRRLFADRDTPLLPAGTPLAVDGAILLRSPLGLLAVDFASGKRIWLRGAAVDSLASADGGDGEESRADGVGGLDRAFSDATCGAVSSNGRFVYAIEAGARERDVGERTRRGAIAPAPEAGASLIAHDLAARGATAWRLPAAADRPDAGPEAAVRYLGAPLTIGDQLFVLAEEKGEIRLDVVDAATGRPLWTQPLAELDEDQQADRPETRARRCSGLSPAFSDGVLVCPTGAGTAIAVDLATRTLLWAYTYPVAGADEDGRAGARGPLGGIMRRVVVNGVPVADHAAPPGGWRDACPIVADGRVLLTPSESDALHCVDLRTGSLRWKVPRGESLYVAGIVAGRALVVGGRGVDALAMEDGTSCWKKPASLAPATVSGRGILTASRLFVPLDTPEVVEIDLADGGIVGRSPARGGVIPGNLLAYRGEVISQGLDSLDVFHQVAPLESRIETAAARQPGDPWTLLWRGQLELDRGRIADGLRSISAARKADPQRVPSDLVADALLFGMRRDFGAAAPLWREITEAAGPLPRSKALLCVAIDNLLAAGALDDAWRTCRELLRLPPSPEGEEGRMVEDLADPALVVAEPRWLGGRITELLSKAPTAVREDVDAFVAAELSAARQAEPAEAAEVYARIGTVFAAHPSAAAARRGELESLEDSRSSARDAERTVAARRELLGISLADAADGSATSDAAAPPVSDSAWPLGRVVAQRGGRMKPEEMMRMSRLIPIPVDPRSRSGVSGLQVGCDVQSQALVLSDGFGRRLGEPIPFDSARNAGMHPLFQPLNAEAAALGPLLVVRSGEACAAFDVGGPGGRPERLWLLADAAAGPAELPAFGLNVNRGRLKRNGNVPLGMRISEPDVPAAVQPARGMVLLPTGLAMIVGNALELRDPVRGVVSWKRHRLPTDGELFGDDEFVCVCPRDGRRALVLATIDGRVVRRCDLPPHELRLAACGRRFVAISPQGPAERVTLEWVDAANDGRVRLGDFSPDARAVQAGPDSLAVLEPNGTLTLVDLGRGLVAFRSTLPSMPAGLERLQVIPWRDRLLVIAGRRESAEEQKQFEKLGRIDPLPQMVPGDDASGAAFSGSIWAVSRTDGGQLWPVPATVVRHCVHRHQPADLPVLVFARHLQPRRDTDRARLSVLALDKRTGHAVYVDDRIGVQPHVFSGCDVSGDPDGHAITLSRIGGDAAEIRLDFTGAPMAPRPPYQAATRPAGGDFLFQIESWLQKAITIPLPF